MNLWIFISCKLWFAIFQAILMVSTVEENNNTFCVLLLSRNVWWLSSMLYGHNTETNSCSFSSLKISKYRTDIRSFSNVAVIVDRFEHPTLIPPRGKTKRNYLVNVSMFDINNNKKISDRTLFADGAWRCSHALSPFNVYIIGFHIFA